MNTPELSDVALPNFQELRRRCVERLWNNPTAQWTNQDHSGLKRIAASYASAHKRPNREDWEFDPCIQAIARDVEDAEPPIPKWACLVAWLAPEGAVTLNQEIISKIAIAALNNTLQREEPEFRLLRRPCPKCEGGMLVEKSGSHGRFLGCTNYSDKRCRYTESI